MNSTRQAPADTADRRAAEVPEGSDFDRLYATRFHDLTLQIYAYLGDRHEAQDVVQEAFCRALARWDRVSGYDDPVAWVRRVAWNLATSRWRRLRTAVAFARRQREEYVAGPDPDRVALVKALDTLPPRQRRAVILHYLADMSVDEVAHHEAVAPGTVKSWLHRARVALAGQLDAEDVRDA
jgi:RNA polymerase sigma-70 factor (ECF subfamily)